MPILLKHESSTACTTPKTTCAGSFSSDTLPMIADFPLFGVGLGGWSAVYPRYMDPLLAGISAGYLHSDPLQILAEVGIVVSASTRSALYRASNRCHTRNARYHRQSSIFASGAHFRALRFPCELLSRLPSSHASHRILYSPLYRSKRCFISIAPLRTLLSSSSHQFGCHAALS